MVDTSVQLGFLNDEINLLFKVPNWSDWDGGKVGGTPVMLIFMRITIYLYSIFLN